MYCQFFKLQTNPFNSVPGPNYHFLPQSHQFVLNQINHAISRETGVSLLLGITGVGKTTLIKRHILKDHDHIDVDFEDLSVHASVHLSIAKVEYAGSALEAALTRQSAGKKSVYLLDHADHFDDDVLANIFAAVILRNQRKHPTLLILVGLTDLVERFETLRFKSFKHLIRNSFTLPQLTVTAVKEYINYRLRFVGYSGKPLFSKAAIQLITKFSNGAPRMINTLCGNSLFQARMGQKRVISEEIVNHACEIFSWGEDDLFDTENELKSIAAIPDQLDLELNAAKISDVTQKQSSSQNIDQSLQEIRQMLVNIGRDEHLVESPTKKEPESVKPRAAKPQIKNIEKPTRVSRSSSSLIDSSQSKVHRDKNVGLLKRKSNDDVVSEPVNTFAPTSTVDDRTKAKFSNWSKPVASSRPTVQSKFSPLYKISAVAVVAMLATVTMFWVVEGQLLGDAPHIFVDNKEALRIVSNAQEEVESNPSHPLQQERMTVEKRNAVDDIQQDEILVSVPEGQNIVLPRPKSAQLAKIASTVKKDKVLIERVKPVPKKEKIIPLPSQNQNVSDNLELAAKKRAEARYKLLQQGVPFSKQSFLFAAANGDNARLELFLNANMPIDVQENLSQNTALIYSAKNGNLRAVQLILNQKPFIDRKNRLGKTALMLAVERKKAKIVKALLRSGANPRVRDASGQTALSIAQKNKDAEILPLLK